ECPDRTKVQLPRRHARLDALADVETARHEIEGVEHDRRAERWAEKLALEFFPFAVEEGAADRLRFAGQDVAKQGEHRADARMPAQHAVCHVLAEFWPTIAEISLD